MIKLALLDIAKYAESAQLPDEVYTGSVEVTYSLLPAEADDQPTQLCLYFTEPSTNNLLAELRLTPDERATIAGVFVLLHKAAGKAEAA